MNRRRTIFMLVLLAGAVLVTSACSDVTIRVGVDEVAGSGRTVSESRDVAAFDRIVLSGEGTVVVVEAPDASLSIETDDNLLTYIRSEVSESTLTLSTKQDVDIDPSNSVIYRVGVPDLSSVELRGAGVFEVPGWEAPRFEVVLAGAGDIKLEGLEAGELDISLPGVGSIVVSGRVDHQTVNLAGAGSYDGGDLRSERAEIRSDGVGDATVWVTDELDITANGIGNISYYGNPQLTQTIRGLASVDSLGPK